jgi:hypothetical protein
VTITLTGDASDSTTTAVDGTYSFAGLVDGDYNVEPSIAGYTFAPTDTDVTISGADDTDNDFVSTQVYITGLPFYIESGWEDGVSVPSFGAQPANDWADLSDPSLDSITNISTPTINSYTPSQSRTIQLNSTGSGTTKFHKLDFLGWVNDGIKFNPADGIRFMVLAARKPDANYTRFDVGVANADASKIIRAQFNDFPDPDTAGIRETYDAYDQGNTSNCTSSTARTTETWVALGLEIPAGYSGDISSRVVVLSGGAPGTGSASRTITNNWSAIDINRLSFFSIKDGIGDVYVCWMWVGTASDDWPV